MSSSLPRAESLTHSVRAFRKRRRQLRRRYLVLALLAAAVAGGWWWWRSRAAAAPKLPGAGSLGVDADRIRKADFGSFNISILVDGTLEAIKRHDLRMMARRHFPLVATYVVDNNAEVREGSVVMEFQKDKFVEKVEDLDRLLDENAKDYALAVDQLAMKRSSNLANIKTSTDDLWNAEDSLEKYSDLEAPKARRDLLAAIADTTSLIDAAKLELSDAEAKLTAAKAEGGASAIATAEATVVTKTKAVEAAEKNLATANHNYRVWKQYDFPQKQRSLQATVERGKLNLRRVTTEAESNVFQSERHIAWLQARRKQLVSERQGYMEDIDNLVLKAPVSGIISLGNLNRPRWEQPKEWKVGVEVNTREICASIPDLSRYMVKCQIPEEQRSKAKVDQAATCRSAALPELKAMTGKVTEISPVSTNIDPRDSSSPKVYDTEIAVDTIDDRLKPGMTVKVEIVVETVKDVVYVPLEAVYRRGDKRFVQVRGKKGLSEEREVEPGRFSFDFVEIRSGLGEGEEVLVAPSRTEAAGQG